MDFCFFDFALDRDDLPVFPVLPVLAVFAVFDSKLENGPT